MSTNERKLPVLALSACGIPVMLAFAGISTRTVEMQPLSVASADFAVDLARDQRSIHPIDSTINARVTCGVDADDHSTIARGAHSARSVLTDTPWMCVAPDGDHFWVANGDGSTIATYRFVDASDAAGLVNFELVAILDAIGPNSNVADKVADASAGWVDLQLSEDGQWLYQLFEYTGAMAVYEIDGNKLTFVELLTA